MHYLFNLLSILRIKNGIYNERLSWKAIVIIFAIFSICMLFVDNYTISCNGQTCTVIKHKYLASLFKKEIENFEQADVADYKFVCMKHSDHRRTRRNRISNSNRTHNKCELNLILKDDTIINTHQSECNSTYELEQLFQNIIDGNNVERKN